MNNKKLKYEFSEEVVNYLLNSLNRDQLASIQQAKDLMTIVELLQNPIRKDELEREQYEKLKEKFENNNGKA